MTRKLVILDSAKEDFREIKKYVKREFGTNTWNTVNDEYRSIFKVIQEKPQHGLPVPELKELGVTHVKYVLVRQTRVIYEFDDAMVYIKMLISTRRDFVKHLNMRIFS